jgi:hypothetical protein
LILSLRIHPDTTTKENKMKTRFTGFEPIRHDRLIQEYRHDAYKAKHKLPEPTACPVCGAVYHEGRWQWAPRPPQAHEEMCPACHRIHDEFPAGFVTMGGEFFKEHREELLHLIRKVSSINAAAMSSILTTRKNKFLRESD